MTDRRPNILLLLTDEERAPRWMPPGVCFPARERIAARGTTFRNHHVTTAPCSPSRSVIFSGRHTNTTGVTDNVNFSWQSSLSPALPTIGTWLRAAGYRTAYKGKWHLSHDRLRDGALDEYGFGYWQGPDRHGKPWTGQLQDGLVARQAERWLVDHGRGAQPWMLAVSFVNPHDIMLYPRFRRPLVHDHGARLPDNFYDDLTTKPSVQRAWRSTCDLLAGKVRSEDGWRMIANAYVDLMLEVDRHVGRVLDALRAAGAEDDTVVLFTSDHGDMAGAHGLRQKGAFVYRENLNVPLVVAWPGVTRAGSETHGLSSAVDIAATCCDIAGIESSLPGRSLVPALRDPGVAVRDSVLFTSDAYSSLGTSDCRQGFLRGIHDGRWKFARYFAPGDQHASIDECELELYDTFEDPGELRNLALDPAYRSVVDDCAMRLGALVEAEMGADDAVPPRPSGAWQTFGDLMSRRRVPRFHRI